MAKKKDKTAIKKRVIKKKQKMKALEYLKKVSGAWGNLAIKIKELYKTKPQVRLISIGTTIAIILGTLDTMGRVVSGLDFIQYLLNWRTNIFNFLVLVGIILLVILISVLWKLFESNSRFRYFGIILTIIFIAGASFGLKKYIYMREEKLIVLIAQFDDVSGDYYAFRNTMYEKLYEDYATDDSISIETIDVIIKPSSKSGSPRARALGKIYQADIVIWGWYRPTENPNITIHVENLSTDKINTLQASETYQPLATLAQLESFEIQRQLGSETKYIVN